MSLYERHMVVKPLYEDGRYAYIDYLRDIIDIEDLDDDFKEQSLFASDHDGEFCKEVLLAKVDSVITVFFSLFTPDGLDCGGSKRYKDLGEAKADFDLIISEFNHLAGASNNEYMGNYRLANDVKKDLEKIGFDVTDV